MNPLMDRRLAYCKMCSTFNNNCIVLPAIRFWNVCGMVQSKQHINQIIIITFREDSVDRYKYKLPNECNINIIH